MGLFSKKVKKDFYIDRAEKMINFASLSSIFMYDGLYETSSVFLISNFKPDDVKFFMTVAMATVYIKDLYIHLYNGPQLDRFKELLLIMKNGIDSFDETNGWNAHLDCDNYMDGRSDTDYRLVVTWIVWNILGKKPESIEEKNLVIHINSLFYMPIFNDDYWEESVSKW